MPIATTLETTLDYDDIGSGAPLLIAHGGPGLHRGVYRTLAPLSDGRRRLILWDHRGHGRSGPLPDGDIAMEMFARDALALADVLGIERFALFGHSFGGWVAQELAITHPERVSALILAGTTPGQLGTTESPDDDQGPPPPDEVAELMSRVPNSDDELIEIYDALAPYLLNTPGSAELRADLVSGLVSAESMVRVYAALGVWSSVDRLGNISCPTLVVGGRRDVFCSPPQQHRIASRISGADLDWCENAGHFMWLEEPGRFFPLVNGWLDTHG